MAQILIRGGTVIDGSGRPAFAADVRVEGEKITAIASNLSPREGERVIDASGCIVSPGFIESHTHFDGNMWWQPEMDPLPGYGVTTAIMGNCGFSAAPVAEEASVRLEMIKIFSFFEDIPEAPFVKLLPWDWRSWPEYKASLTSKVKPACNYALYVGHIAIRLAAMGMDAWTRAANPQEIETMAHMLDAALNAGALGMASNLSDHDANDRPVPSMQADDAEFTALIDVLARHPGSNLQVVLDTFMRMTAPQNVERIARLCADKPVRVQWVGLPTLMFQKPIQGAMIDQHERFKRDKLDFWTGFSHVSPTSTLSVQRSLIFAQTNDYVWHEVVKAETQEAKLALLNDPNWRERARHSWDHDIWEHAPMKFPQALFLANSDNGAGPHDISLAEYAEQLGVHASDAMATWLINNGLESTVQMAPFDLDEEMIIRLLKDPKTVGNISDAPAHGQMLCGGGENMQLFTKYVQKLGVLTLEEAVHVQTGKLAQFFNLHDRGELAVGKRADITVFKLDEIKRRKKRKAYDVPDGSGGFTWRWTRGAAPMRLTMVNGETTFENETGYTGNNPGQFLCPVTTAACA